MEPSDELNKDKKEDVTEKEEEKKEEKIEQKSGDKSDETVIEKKEEKVENAKNEKNEKIEEPKQVGTEYIELSNNVLVTTNTTTTTSNFSESANQTQFQFTNNIISEDTNKDGGTGEVPQFQNTINKFTCTIAVSKEAKEQSKEQKEKEKENERETESDSALKKYLEHHIEALKNQDSHMSEFERYLRKCLEKGFLKEKCRKCWNRRKDKLFGDEGKKIQGDFSKEPNAKKVVKEEYTEEEKAKRNKILQDAFAEPVKLSLDVWKDVDYTKVEYVKLINEEDLCNLVHLESKGESHEESQINKKRFSRDEMHTQNDQKNDFLKSENERKHNDKESSEMIISPVDKTFVQTPLKCILNTFRLFQKDLERHITVITLFIEKKMDHLSDEEALEKLNTIIQKLESLKKKTAEIRLILNKCVRRLYNRLRTIHSEADIEMESLKRNFQMEMFSHRYNWLIDEFLCRNGYFESEEVFRERYDLESYTDVDVYKEYLHIMAELKKHNTEPALSWSQKFKSQLKKIDMNIESELHLQHVINLVVDKKHAEAINYIKKNVAKPWGSISVDIRFIITHIGLNNSLDTFKDFINRRWKKVIKLFSKVYSDITGIPHRPTLELLLKAGISTIKSDHCTVGKSTKCPTCIRELEDIVPLLPSLSKTRSFIVCPYTGELMDENNPPFTIPSGKVYSEKCIMSHIDESANFVCPDTKEEVPISKIARLFI